MPLDVLDREVEATPYVGRRRSLAPTVHARPEPVAVPPPIQRVQPVQRVQPAAVVERRVRSGATVPAAAAAALSLVATGIGVAASVDGAANAQPRHPAPATLHTASAAEIGSTTQDVQTLVAERRVVAQEQASRAAERAALAVTTAAAHRWVLPLTHYVLSSPFGIRWGKLHAGEDFAAPIGSPAHAISSGVVVFAGVEGGYGNKVEIRHWDGTCSWYGHLSKIEVKVGQKVDSGQVIALTGDTGHSTGPHLHLEIHPNGKGPVDPLPWLRAHGLHP